MTISPGFTTEQVRAYVYEYHQQRSGTKTQWLAKQPFSSSTLRRWQAAVFSGDLDRGLVPRETGGMTPRRKREIAEHSLHDSHDAEIAALHDRIRMLEGANDALGKAIGLLHAMREEEPDGPATMTQSSDS